MTPGFKFLGIVFLVALFTIACVNGAHAAEASPDESCVVAMAPEVGRIYDQLEAGMEPAIVRYFVRTDERYGDAGRWFLVSFVNAWERADRIGIHHPRAEAIDIAMGLCRAEPGQVPAAFGGFGAVRDLRNVEI